jgi:hypothetical protein
MDVKQVVPGCPSPATPISHTKLNNFEILAYASDSKVVIMTSQLAVLQILDLHNKNSTKKSSSDSSRPTPSPSFASVNYAVPGMKSARPATSSTPTETSKQDKSSFASNPTPVNAKVTHIEWQGQGKATLAVCFGTDVYLFHPVSKRAIVKRAEKEAPSLLPLLKSIMTTSSTGPNESGTKGATKSTNTPLSSKGSNKSSTLPCLVSTSVLAHASLRLERFDIEQFDDINDIIFQERMVIEHDFVPTSVSFTCIQDENKWSQVDEGEYLLVGGDTSIVLWRLRRQVIDPPEKSRKSRTRGGLDELGVVQTSHSFNPARRLGARIGINGIVGLTFNEKSDNKPKKRVSGAGAFTAPAEEFTRESSMGLGTLDQALGRGTTSSSTASQSSSHVETVNLFAETQIPWGQVRDWYMDEDEDGNSLFPNVKTPYRKLWVKKVAGVRLVSFSPDGRLFASVGQSDRHVKLWYYGQHGLNFTYLAHPRAVADIQWRRYHAKREFCRNVIMTRLIDGTCMMWEESEPTQRLEFALRLTLTEPVTSVQWLLPPVSYLTDVLDEHVREKGQGSSNIPLQTNISNARASAYVPSHAPSSSSSSYLPLKQQPRGVCPFDSQHRTLPPGEKESLLIAPPSASPKEIQDWVAALQKDGSILLWKVKGLGVPKRVPTATLWSRLKQVISAKVDDFFPHLVVISQRFAFKEKVYQPALLNVYTSSASKRDIACWTVDTSQVNRAQAQLSRRLQGHVSTVSNLQAHPGNTLFSSSDRHRTVIWRVTDTTISDSTFVLQDLCGLPPAKLSRWDPLDSIIYMYLPASPSNSNSSNGVNQSAPVGPNWASPLQRSTTSLQNGSHHHHHAKAGIVAYHVDHHDSESNVSVWATSKNLGALEFSSSLEDDHGHPVQLGHLEVLPPVFFDQNGACVKLPAHESLVLGASEDGRVIFIWKVTKDVTGKRTGSQYPSNAKSSSSSTHVGPTSTSASHHQAAPATSTSHTTTAASFSHLVGSPSAPWQAASPLDKPLAFVSTAAIALPSETNKPAMLLSASSSQIRMDSLASDVLAHQSASGIKSELIVRYVLPEAARLTCLAKPVSTHIRDMRQHQSDASLFTGGIDGVVRAWRLHKKLSSSSSTASSRDHPSQLDQYQWLPLLYFKAHEEPVETIRCASFGRMATASVSGLEIKIWECESSSPNFLLESVIKAQTEVKETTSKYNTTGGFSAAASIIKSKDASLQTQDSDSEDSGDEDTLDPYATMMARTGVLRTNVGSGALLRASTPSLNLHSSTSSMTSDTTSATWQSDTDGGVQKSGKNGKKSRKSGTAFDWVSGPTGSPMLAVVGFGSTRVFAQRATTDLFEFKARWVPVGTARVSGSCVAWTGVGQLVVGQGNRLLVFTNWIADSTLTSIAEHYHAALPYYHPKVIFELVMAGRLDRAHASFQALYSSLATSVPLLFENTAGSDSYSTVAYQDADDAYTAALLEAHPDLQRDKDEKSILDDDSDGEEGDKFDANGKKIKKPKMVPVDAVEALAFETDEKLLQVGELFLTQKRLGINSLSSVSVQAASLGSQTQPTNSTSSGAVDGAISPDSHKVGSPAPEISIPDFDPMAYDPTSYDPTGYDPTSSGVGGKDKSKGLFDSDSDKDENAYVPHFDDDSRYNIGGMDDNASDSSDDFWGSKKGSESAAHKRFLDDGLDGDDEDGSASRDAAVGPASSAGGNSNVGGPSEPSNEKQNFRWNFDIISSQKASQLCNALSRCVITGLPGEEQGFLVALIDTLSNLEQTWLDAAAVRFIVMTRFFLWLQRSNKIPAGASVSSLTWCWALHTSDQQSLLQHCFPQSSVSSGTSLAGPPADAKADASKFPLLWETVRALGVPLWLTNLDSLRKLCQDLATQHYLVKKDPADAALWYLLIGKKSALSALYKVTRDDKKGEFLANDFSQERWKSAAVTNAYSLMQRHQYQMAASMFVLAGKLADAVDVCLSKLDDYMLALFIARVGCNMDDGAQSKRVMEIGLKSARENGDQHKESALLWLMNDYKASLGSLIPQAPNTTIILTKNPRDLSIVPSTAHAAASPSLSVPPLSPHSSSKTGLALQAKSRGSSPKPSSSSSLNQRMNISKAGFFSDEEGNQSDEYDYRQFDIRSGMSDIYGGYGRTGGDGSDSGNSDSETDATGSGNVMSPGEVDRDSQLVVSAAAECTNPLYQHHEYMELNPEKVLASHVTPDFHPGIRWLFDFVLSHPTLKLAMQEAEKKSAEMLNSEHVGGGAGQHNHPTLSRASSRLSVTQSMSGSLMRQSNMTKSTSASAVGGATTAEGRHHADLLMLGELRMKDFLHRKIVYTYIHAGLSRLVLQGDLDELAERVFPIDPTALDTPVDACLLDASQSPVLSIGSELVARELEFKCAVQFLSKEIEAHRGLQSSASLDTYNRFLQLILTYHSALTPDSIVAALGQFCEHRLYLFHHYLLLRTSSAATPIIYSTSSASTSAVVGALQPIPVASIANQSETAQNSVDHPSTASHEGTTTSPAAMVAKDSIHATQAPSTTSEVSLRTKSELVVPTGLNAHSADPSPASSTSKSAVRDPAAAGQLLIRTAQKITALCQTLVTNPLSEHQAKTTRDLAHELATCLAIHVSDAAVTFSAKAKAGVGAAVRLGLFVASWSIRDYAALFDLLSSHPTLENPRGPLLHPEDSDSTMKFETLSSVSTDSAGHHPPYGNVETPGNPDTLIPVVSPTPRKGMGSEETETASALPPHITQTFSVSAPSSPASGLTGTLITPRPVSTGVTETSLTSSGNPTSSALALAAANLFPTKEEQRRLEMLNKAPLRSSEHGEPISTQTELFLSRLLDVVLLVAFTQQQEDFLSGSFPNPGSLNLLKTLRMWMQQLENQLKDIPVQIIEERLQDITEKESRFVFDIGFFASFIRETALYNAEEVAPKLWTLLASLPCVNQYLHNADYLKQSMRFVRMHNQLRDDFDEAERNEALQTAAAWRSLAAPSAIIAGSASSTSVSSRRESGAVSATKEPHKINVKLGEPLSLFKHKEIIQSFCISATCRKQIAIATSIGIIEVNVEHKAPLPFMIKSDPASTAHHTHTGSGAGTSSMTQGGGFSSATTDALLASATGPGHRRTNSDGSASVMSSGSMQAPHGMGDLSSLLSTTSSTRSSFAAQSSAGGMGGLLSTGAFATPQTGFSSSSLNATQAGLLPSSSSSSFLSGSGALSGSSSLNSSTFSLLPEIIEKQDIALWLENHPTLPYFLSASSDGPVKLWQFSVAPSPLTTYRSKHKAKALKVKFNHNGNKFAAIDTSGNLEMWRFDANEDSVDPFLSLPVMKRATDLTFMNAGSVLAIAGEGAQGKNVCMVDTLIAPNKAIVASYNAHESANGATAVAYSARHQLLISGGQRGQIVVYDARQRIIIATIDAHMKAVKDIFIDPTQTFFVSGSADGNIKFWSLINFKELNSWSSAHVAKGITRSMSSITGVTQVRLSRNSIYSCGADGRLFQRRYAAIELNK